MRTTFLTLATLAIGIVIGGVLSANTASAAGGSQKTAPTGKVTPWAAMATAQSRTHQRPIQATFEFEDGHWQYAVFTAGHGTVNEVEIDAQTGKVGDVEKADPVGEGKELQSLLTKQMKQR